MNTFIYQLIWQMFFRTESRKMDVKIPINFVLIRNFSQKNNTNKQNDICNNQVYSINKLNVFNVAGFVKEA